RRRPRRATCPPPYDPNSTTWGLTSVTPSSGSRSPSSAWRATSSCSARWSGRAKRLTKGVQQAAERLDELLNALLLQLRHHGVQVYTHPAERAQQRLRICRVFQHPVRCGLAVVSVSLERLQRQGVDGVLTD